MLRRNFIRSGVLLGSAGVIGMAGCLGDLPLAGGESTPEPFTETTPSDDVSDRANSVAQAARPKVVAIEITAANAPEQAPGGFGTGWFVDEHHVVTNSHVVEGGGRFTGWTLDGTSFDLTLVDRVDDYADSGVDVALLETEFSGPTLPVKDDPDLTQGQRLMHIGHPGTMGFWIMSIGDYVREEERSNNYLTTIPGAEGSSGSPVVDLDGDVVGMTSGNKPMNATIKTRDNDSPMPADPVLYDEFPENQYTKHVSVEDIDRKLSEWL